MNKSLHIAHWLLVALVVASTAVIAKNSYSIWQINKINAFISSDEKPDQVPDHVNAQFAQAYHYVEKEDNELALAMLTTVAANADAELEAAAYFNRANIHLRDAQVLASDDAARVSLLGLAKQDYRSALLISPTLWDARYNLELSLLMAPEDVDLQQVNKKGRGSSSVVVKAVGFRVDLP